MTLIKKNIANLITLSRIVFTVIFMLLICTVFIYFAENIYCRFLNAYLILCFSAIILSDAADGYMARKMNRVTSTGAKFDLAADMIYVLGTAVILIFNNKMQVWFPAVLVINFISFLVTSRFMSQRSSIHKFAVFDKLGKTAAIMTMLLPGLFGFRCIIPNYEFIMRLSVLIITGLFCVSFIYRIAAAIVSMKLKNR